MPPTEDQQAYLRKLAQQAAAGRARQATVAQPALAPNRLRLAGFLLFQHGHRLISYTALVCFFVLPLASIFIFREVWVGAPIAFAIVALLVFWLPQRELSFLSRLPFPMEGYLVALQFTADGRQHAKARMVVQFEGEAPPASAAQNLMTTITAASGDWYMRQKAPWDFEISVSWAPILAPIHALVERGLVPLHAAYPLSSVEWEGTGSGEF